VGVSGFPTFKNIWHDLNYKNANNFLGLKLPNNMHIEILSISEVAAGKKCHVIISNQGKPFAHCSKMTGSTRDRLHTFFSKSPYPLSD
jgi:hypothetical protein